MVKKSTFLVILFLLGLRFYFFLTIPKPFMEGDTIRISARLGSEAVRYETKQYLKLEGLKVYLPLYPEVNYGDYVVIEGVVRGDSLVDPKLVSTKENKSLGYKTRQILIDNYKKALPKPHSSLIAGMVLGSRSDIQRDFWERLKSSGTAHVVVASGMNVSLVANFLIAFLTLFWRRGKALMFTILGIWLYAFLTGFDAPIIRAGVMGTIAFLAQYLGRVSEAIRALFISAFLMLIVSPGYLWDLGFLLSFFATLSLVLFEPRIRNLISRVRPLRAWRRSEPEAFLWLDPIRKTVVNDLSTSLAAQVGVGPILYYYFGQVNLLSPLINMLILWTVVPITIIGMVGGVAGLLFEPLGRAILYLVYPLTSWFILIVSLFS